MDIEVGICRYEGSIFRVPSPFFMCILVVFDRGVFFDGPAGFPLFSSNYFFHLLSLLDTTTA